MKFVIAMMLAGVVLAFAGVNEAFAQVAPSAGNIEVTTTRDGRALIELIQDGHVNDPDGDNTQLTITVGETPAGSAFVGKSPRYLLSWLGSVDPRTEANATYTFTYTVTSDVTTLTSDVARITIHVHPLYGVPNTAPSFRPIPEIDLIVSGSEEVDLAPFIIDDDPNYPHRVTFQLDPRGTDWGGFWQANGTKILYSAPSSYDNPADSVVQSFIVIVFDDTQGSDPATLRFRINDPDKRDQQPAPNTAPTATDGQASAQTGQTISIPLADLIADAEDADSALTVTISTQPATGSASVTGTTISYTAGNTAGDVTIGYTVTDTGDLTAAGTITVRVTAPTPEPEPEPINTPPSITAPPTASTLEAGSSVTIPLTITDTEDDAAGTPLTVDITQPTVGNAVHTPTGITYTAPEGAEAGTYSIVITATDSDGESTSITVEVIIVEGNTVAIRACTR